MSDILKKSEKGSVIYPYITLPVIFLYTLHSRLPCHAVNRCSLPEAYQLRLLFRRRRM